MKLKHLISTSAMIVAGFSSNQAGAVETSFLMCQSCPAGTYSTGGTSKSCTPCPKGQYQNLAGASSCKVCPAGRYSSTTGASGCNICPSGTYSSAGSTSCTKCPAGTYSSAGAGSCSTCSAGTYSTAGASSCTSCPIGQYQNETGASSCKACNANGNTYEGPSCGSNRKYAVKYCTTTGSTSATANSSKTFLGNVSFGCSSGYTCSGGSCVKKTPTEQCPRGEFVSFTECYESLSHGSGYSSDYGRYPYYKYKDGRCVFDGYGPCTRR
ncbi:MAG: hypothetical protein K6F04_02065 [bacterium]|nr:hypothetical protein [bacterium]